jgi:hypothetical protein
MRATAILQCIHKNTNSKLNKAFQSKVIQQLQH